jgi:hypothetical protein
MLASAGIQAIGSISSGYSQAKALRAQQQMDYANADSANATANADTEQVLRRGHQALGEQSASTAEAGIGFTGTGADLLNQSANNVQLDALNTLYGGQVKAATSRNAGLAAGKQAQGAITSGWIGAATSVLSASARYGQPASAKPKVSAAMGGGSIGSYGGSYTGASMVGGY